MKRGKVALKLRLESDNANYGYRDTFKNKLYNIWCPNYSLKYVRILRYKTYYEASEGLVYEVLFRICQYRLHRLSLKTGFYIPKDVFGPGVFIPHTGSVIVNPNAKIGSNCLINNNVVIGQNKGKCPIIGDNVFIGAGAVICGDIHIESNVWIGANSVVTKDITERGILVAGIPAKTIRHKDLNWKQEFKKYR